jgi:hypothetical protein
MLSFKALYKYMLSALLNTLKIKNNYRQGYKNFFVPNFLY